MTKIIRIDSYVDQAGRDSANQTAGGQDTQKPPPLHTIDLAKELDIRRISQLLRDDDALFVSELYVSLDCRARRLQQSGPSSPGVRAVDPHRGRPKS